ncbi:hypothetical protein [Microbispora sp. ATCC PTA-5024]|uniref:hypothetical protein n=1 Tax=Microbispora sp. ATCC PTA-5024 TaxID=316330 RepID=UPI000688493F|nr:hypothetical protein [Microbispora sp. ATCC PTA-5024]
MIDRPSRSRPSAGRGAAMRKLPGFAAFAADQAPVLARTAYLLTGDASASRRLVEAALTSVADRWSAVRWSFPAHEARAALFAAGLRRTRSPRMPSADASKPVSSPADSAGSSRVGSFPADSSPAGSSPADSAGSSRVGSFPADSSSADRAGLVAALAALPPRGRALVVARFHEGAGERQAADLCRTKPTTAGAETAAALAELRRRLPHLAGYAPEEPEEAREADEETASASSDPPPTPGPDEPARRETAAASGSGMPPWVSPSSPPELGPWASPDGSPYGNGRDGGPDGGDGHGGDGGPRHPGDAWRPEDAGEDPWHEGLRRALAGLASEAPPFARHAPPLDAHRAPPIDAGLAREAPALDPALAVTPADGDAEDGFVAGVLDSVVRHRARRTAFTTSVVVTMAALVVTPFAFGLAAVVSRAQDASAVPVHSPMTTMPKEASPAEGPDGTPGPLPSVVRDPIRYAYRGSCTGFEDEVEEGDEANDEAGGGPVCEQWRVVTTGGEQWRVPDVDLGQGTGRRLQFAVSADGNRMAYFSTNLPDFVVMDRRHSVPEWSEISDGMERIPHDTGLVISPAGRWIAVDFGAGARAPKPRLHDFTRNRTWVLPQRVEVLAVAENGTLTATLTRDDPHAPGRLRTTTLVRIRPDGRVLSHVRVDPALFGAGAAPSPDGRLLALASERAHPRQGDHGLLVTMDVATGRLRGRVEAALASRTRLLGVRGWADDHEVLVEAARTAGEDGDDGMTLQAVDVRSGSARPIALGGTGRLPATWVPGVIAAP